MLKLAIAPEYLRCGEYAFRVPINPRGDPEIDENIEHLRVLLVILYNTCGGVIYLTTEGSKSVDRPIFEGFEKIFFDMIKKKTGLSKHLFSFEKISLTFETQTSWGVLILPSTTEGNQTDTLPYFRLDIDGNLHPENFHHEMRSANKNSSINQHANMYKTADHQERPRANVLGQGEQPPPGDDSGPDSMDSADEGETLDGSSNRKATPSSGQTEETPPADIPRVGNTDIVNVVDYSSYQKLDWTSHKKDWKTYMNVDMLTKCDMLQPQSPMAITPERDQLQYMFQSRSDMDRVLDTCTVNKNVCGFAIACKSWASIVSNNKTDIRPRGHICDILIVSKEGRINF